MNETVNYISKLNPVIGETIECDVFCNGMVKTWTIIAITKTTMKLHIYTKYGGEVTAKIKKHPKDQYWRDISGKLRADFYGRVEQ